MLRLREGGCVALLCSPAFAFCPLNRPPKQWHLFVQSSCASMVEASVVPLHPLIAKMFPSPEKHNGGLVTNKC